jgi:hypothetical protein
MLTRIVLVFFVLMAAGCANQETIAKKKTPLLEISFSGGNGESSDSAIVISGVQKQSEGVDAEYRYLSKLHGEKGKGWKIEGQTISKEEKKVFDVIEIVLIPSSQKRIYYFDVSKFPWKRKLERP